MIDFNKLNAQIEQLSKLQSAIDAQKNILNTIVSEAKQKLGKEETETLTKFENELNTVFEKVKNQDASYIQDFENITKRFNKCQ